MDTIRYLLGVIVKLVFGLLLAALVWWLIGLLFPNLKATTLLNSKTFSGDWLPAPKNYKGLFGNRTANTNGMNGTVYQSGAPYNGYANQGAYGNTYGNGADVVWSNSTTGDTGSNANNQVFTGNTTAYAEKSLYIRNLSVYEGGNIQYGMTFVGEARDTMFKDGAFPIVIIDRGGHILAVMQATNTRTWAAPGWVRFQATIPNRLPNGLDCALVFYSENQPIKVGLAVRCI
jgi:hypothetical protein